MNKFLVKKDTQVTMTDLGTSYRLTLCNISKKSIKWHTMIKLRYGRKMKENYFDARSGELIRNPESERRSVRRAQCAIVDLAKLNNFEYFGTLTIDSAKHNVYDVKETTSKMLAALHSYEQLSDGFMYILVPEFGSKTGRLHYHFLMKGIRHSDLFKNEYGKLDFRYFKHRFGHVQISKIRQSRADIERVSTYCAKYMSKDNVQIGTHRYFRSKGLKKPIKRSYTLDFLARTVNRFLKSYEDAACYYDEKCKCYDLPRPLALRLYDYVQDWLHRWEWLRSSEEYEKIYQLRIRI